MTDHLSGLIHHQ